MKKFEYVITVLKKQWADIEAGLILAEGGMRQRDIDKFKAWKRELEEVMEILAGK